MPYAAALVPLWQQEPGPITLVPCPSILHKELQSMAVFVLFHLTYST